MSCLATWRDGSSRYLVALMNHSHVYTDESRYRCFIYQRQRQSSSSTSKPSTTYKMAQSTQASCLGLWSVDEGYRTFNLKKCEQTRLFPLIGHECILCVRFVSVSKDSCHFPSWLSRHHDWQSLDDQSSIHLNKRGHSLRLRNRTASFGGGAEATETHSTCHQVEKSGREDARIVVHTKSGW